MARHLFVGLPKLSQPKWRKTVVKKGKSSASNGIWGIIFTISIGILVAMWLTNPQEVRENWETVSNTLRETYEDASIDIQTRRGEETGPFGISIGEPVGRYDYHITTRSGFDHQYGNYNEEFDIDVYSCPTDEIPRPHFGLNNYYVLSNEQSGISDGPKAHQAHEANDAASGDTDAAHPEHALDRARSACGTLH